MRGSDRYHQRQPVPIRRAAPRRRRRRRAASSDVWRARGGDDYCDFCLVVTHPTTASHCDTYGHSGDASNDSAARKHYKYDPIIDQHHLNFRLIP
eukprot:COSAG01_NODE_60443_length_294_cov_7.174359_1_plen_94_part_10